MNSIESAYKKYKDLQFTFQKLSEVGTVPHLLEDIEKDMQGAEKEAIDMIQKQSIEKQVKQREKYIQEKKLVPCQDLPENREPKFSYNNKFDLLQLLFSPLDHYVQAAPGEETQDLIDGCVCDPVKLAQSDGIHFKRRGLIPRYQNYDKVDLIKLIAAKIPEFKNALKNAQPLKLQRKENDTKSDHTNRLLLIDAPGQMTDGKIVMLKKIPVLSEQNIEKKSFETGFEVHNNIYACIRKHGYILEQEQNLQKDYLEIRGNISWLKKHIKTDPQKAEEVLALVQTKIQTHIAFFVAYLRENRLGEVDFAHGQRDQNRIRGAENDLEKRLQQVQGIIQELDFQKSQLEITLEKHEKALWQWYHDLERAFNMRQTSNTIKIIQEAYTRYQAAYSEIENKPAPFTSLHTQIAKIMNQQELDDDAFYQTGQEKWDFIIQCLKALTSLQKTIVNAYQFSHELYKNEVLAKDVEVGDIGDPSQLPGYYEKALQQIPQIQTKEGLLEQLWKITDDIKFQEAFSQIPRIQIQSKSSKNTIPQDVSDFIAQARKKKGLE